MLNVAEEVKEPKRNIPRGLILAVLISSLIYIAVSLIAVSVIPAQELAKSDQPLVDVVARAAPWFPTKIFSVIALFAVANTALLNFVMGSRLLYGMSRTGLAPKFLNHIHPKRKTPDIAVGVVWILFALLVATGDISSLAKATSVLLLSCFILVNISLIVLKRKEKPEGTFEVPYLIPALGAMVCFAMLTKAQATELTTAGAIIAVIVVMYFIMRPPGQAVENMN